MNVDRAVRPQRAAERPRPDRADRVPRAARRRRRVPVVRQHQHDARQLGADELPLRQPRRHREPDAQHLEPVASRRPTTSSAARASSTTPSSPTTSPPIGKLRLRATLGYFFNNYGNLGQYTAGIYQSPYVGAARGVGGMLLGRVPADAAAVAARRGRRSWATATAARPAGTAPANPNNNVDPLFGASYIHHLHAGLIRKTDVTLQGAAALDGQLGAGRPPAVRRRRHARCRTTWSRAGSTSRTSPTGGSPSYGVDASMTHPVWGLLAIGGVAHRRARRLAAARAAHVRRRGAAADRALAGRRHRRHRPGRRRRASTTAAAWGGSSPAPGRSTPTAPTC